MLVEVPNNPSVDLSIISIEKIRPHERTIPQLLSSIRKDMLRSGSQRDPILIDSKTKLALDGMHRRAALESLGAKFALCAEYDYLTDLVKLERWLRYFIAPNEQLLAEISSVFRLKRCNDFRKAASIVDSGRSCFALLSASDSYVSDEKWDVLRVYENVGRMDQLCEKAGVDLQFAPELEKFSLFTSESVYVMYPTKISKEDVVRMVKNKGVFPYKTTRHIVPIRPMGLCFPLEHLQKFSMPDCTNELEQIVRLSKIGVEKIDVWYEGRRYSEPLAIFRRPSQ